MLVQAIECDLLVRIGWGREGDEKPKTARLVRLAYFQMGRGHCSLEIGEGAGLMNRGGLRPCRIVASMAADGCPRADWSWRKMLARVGFKMSGGSIVIHGSRR